MRNKDESPNSSTCWEAFLHARKRLIDAWAAEKLPDYLVLGSLQVDPVQVAGIRSHVTTGTEKQLQIERLEHDLAYAKAERQARLDAAVADDLRLVEEVIGRGRCPLDNFMLSRRLRPDLPAAARLYEAYCRCGFTFGLG